MLSDPYCMLAEQQIMLRRTTVSSSPFFSAFQDYHWWWRSFLTSGFTAFYLFIYCVHYFVTKLNIEGVVSTILYFGYTFIMVFLFFILTGRWLQAQQVKLWVCMRTFTRTYLQSYIYLHMYIPTYIHTCIGTYTYICTILHTYIPTYVYTYI